MKKIKVMIVDDDKLALDDLISLFDWTEYGFEIVAVAYNGEQAFEKYQLLLPQVVITDIRMPISTGIELVANIRRVSDTTKILLLTAFSDFDYAKKAIQLGITDYIIKNEINEVTIKEKLLFIKDLIRVELETNNLLFEKILSDIFNSDIKLMSLESLKPAIQVFLNSSYFYIIVEKDLPILFDGEIIRDVQGNEKNIISCCMSYCIQDVKLISACTVRHNQVVILDQIEKTISQSLAESQIMKTAQDIKEHLEDEFHNPFTLFVMPFQLNPIEMKKLYIEKIEQFYVKCLLGNGKIYNFSDLKLNFSNLSIGIDEKYVEELIWGMDVEGLRCYVSDIYCKIIAALDYKSLLKASRDFYRIIRKQIEKIEIIEQRTCLLNLINNSTLMNAEDIKTWIIDTVSQLIKVRQKEKERRYSNVVINALNYIYKNYGNKDLTINKIADYVSMSYARLSFVFKEETTKTINEYITGIRIEEAKKLLCEGKLKIYEISSNVGYGSSQYFSQIFFNVTGIQPNDYRKKGC
jgi:two-component system, response regulator YesN